MLLRILQSSTLLLAAVAACTSGKTVGLARPGAEAVAECPRVPSAAEVAAMSPEQIHELASHVITPRTPGYQVQPDGTRFYYEPLPESRVAKTYLILKKWECESRLLGHWKVATGTRTYSIPTFAVTEGRRTFIFQGKAQIDRYSDKTVIVDSETGEAHNFSTSAQVQAGTGKLYVAPGKELPRWAADSGASLIETAQ